MIQLFKHFNINHININILTTTAQSQQKIRLLLVPHPDVCWNRLDGVGAQKMGPKIALPKMFSMYF